MLLSRTLSECKQPQILLSLCATWGQQEHYSCRQSQASNMPDIKRMTSTSATALHGLTLACRSCASSSQPAREAVVSPASRDMSSWAYRLRSIVESMYTNSLPLVPAFGSLGF